MFRPLNIYLLLLLAVTLLGSISLQNAQKQRTGLLPLTEATSPSNPLNLAN